MAYLNIFKGSIIKSCSLHLTESIRPPLSFIKEQVININQTPTSYQGRNECRSYILHSLISFDLDKYLSPFHIPQI